jgi:tetratricopeptide (TPR) repeat protein/transcriptional regulator with XRE-family HTH domain
MDRGQGPPFGELLRRYRVACALTQEALAERAGLSVRTVSDLERGINRTPRKDTLPLLVAALGLSAAESSHLDVAARRLKSAQRASPALTPPYGPPLVGRGRELDAVERHLAGEGPPVLLLAGEPGIGKSRLLQEAGARASRAGWTVLAGGCHRRGGQDPYAPLLQALERYIRPQPPAQRRTDLRGCAWLVRLLPELADGPIEPLPDWTLAPEQERRLVVASVARFLANVAGPGGTLLLLDDLQWTGADALDLLATLARATPQTPLRVIGAYRYTDVQPSDPLAAVLADLVHAGLAARRLLRPLTPAEAAALLDDLLDGGAAADAERRAQILRRAGGVPFFLMSCARAARLGEDESPEAVPWDVAQSVRLRVAALPAVARDLLGVAAVLGREIPYAVLRTATAHPEDEVLVALEAACQAHLLEPADQSYHFVHDVIREVLETDVGLARRAVLHRRVAETLEQGPWPPVEEVAYHYAHTPDHAQAAQWLERAGDRAAAGFATVAALDHYATARERLIACGADTATLSRLDEKLGDVRLLLSAYTQAQQDFARARTPQTEGARRVDLWRKEGVAWEKLGDYPRALAAFAAAEEQDARDGTEIPAQVRAEVELGRANVYGGQGPWEAEEAAAERALALVSGESPTVATSRIRAWAAWHQAMVAWSRGDVARMEERFGQMRAFAERSGDRYGSGRAWHGLGMAAWQRGDLAPAAERFRSALALLKPIGDDAALAFCWWGLGAVAVEWGDVALAEQYFRCSLDLLEQTGHQAGLPHAWGGLGQVAWARGDLAQAEECFRRGLTIGEGLGDEWLIAHCLHRLGAIAGERGDLSAAARWCRGPRPWPWFPFSYRSAARTPAGLCRRLAGRPAGGQRGVLGRGRRFRGLRHHLACGCL